MRHALIVFASAALLMLAGGARGEPVHAPFYDPPQCQDSRGHVVACLPGTKPGCYKLRFGPADRVPIQCIETGTLHAGDAKATCATNPAMCSTAAPGVTPAPKPTTPNIVH